MTHLSSFEAVHYRGLDGLSIPRLSAANLVTGANGVGKTALLEAMWLFIHRHSPVLLWNKNIQRSGNPVVDPVARLSSGVLELHGVENGSEHRLRSTFEHVPAAGAPAVDGYTSLPIVGRLDTCIARRRRRNRRPAPSVWRYGTICKSQSYGATTTKYHLDTSGSYLQYYSEMVRDAGKDELRSALNIMLPNVIDTKRIESGWLPSMTRPLRVLVISTWRSDSARLDDSRGPIVASRGER